MIKIRRVLVGVLVVLLSTSSLLLVGESPASADCPEFMFIGARGSGQGPGDYGAGSQFGMGNEVFNIYAELANKIGGARVSPYGVVYDAVPIGLFEGLSDGLQGARNFLSAAGLPIVGDYHDSVDGGFDNAMGQIVTFHSICSTTK